MLDFAKHGTSPVPRSVFDYIGPQASRFGGSQWPVSFRAVPETVSLLFAASRDYFEEIENELVRPSSNPLVSRRTGTLRPYAQASFMLPLLAVKTSQVIESLLFSASSSVARTKWLLSGHVEGIPVDGQADCNDVAFIQWPKLMQAMVEEMRLLLGRSLYASGGDTSFGVEDLWSYGVYNLDRLSKGMELSERIHALAIRLKVRVGDRFSRDTGLDEEVMAICRSGSGPAAEAAGLVQHYSGPSALWLRDAVFHGV